jgi:hypothetical protein
MRIAQKPSGQNQGGQASHRTTTFLLASAAMLILFFAIAGSASAFTIGASWSGSWTGTETEMPGVAEVGAEVLRVPLTPEEAPHGNWTLHYDPIFKRAAENGVRILPIIQSSGAAPTSPGQVVPEGEQSWGQFVEEAVGRYGYNGSFWYENPSVPLLPATTWELDNEPNNKGISTYVPASTYGSFVGWAAPEIQSVTEAHAAHGTEVLFGSLFLWGDESSFNNTLDYAATAWLAAGAPSAVTGFSIHPYDLESSSFKPGYSQIQAFEYAVEHFRTGVTGHTGLNGLEHGAEKTLWITETGWPAEGPEFSVGTSGQATLLSQSFQYARNHSGSLKLQGYVWYNVRDAAGSNWAAYCGLVAANGTHRPAWATFQALANPPQGPEIRVAYRDTGDANSISGWEASTTSGWQQVFLWGHEVMAGSSPALLRYGGSTHIYFADADREDRITEWDWNKVSGWQQHFLETDPVSANSSPSAVYYEGRPEVYFADRATNNEITQIKLNGSTWEQVRFYRDEAAPNTSPSAVNTSGSVRVFFNDANLGEKMAVWTVNAVTVEMARLGGDQFAAGSSPSAVFDGQTMDAFFSDANDNGELSAWVWGPTTLYQQNYYVDPVAAGSSPSAVKTPGSVQVYFADAAHGNTMSVRVLVPGGETYQANFGGDAIAKGSSPASIPNSGQQEIFFSDENTNGSIAFWEWGPTFLTQSRLYGHLVAPGSSPGAAL